MFKQCYDLYVNRPESELSVQVGVAQLSAQCWQLSYQLNDPQQQIIWPNMDTPLEPMRQDYLWQSTCFELFVQAVGSSEYLELNLSPARQWNAYSFDGYRSPAQMPPRRDERVRLNSLNIGRNTLVAVVDLSDCFVTGQALRVGLTCVLKNQAGQCSYWALQHGGQPDFHRASDWLIQVDV
ncbi:MAG: DOMON-like domain-containing protein [Flavobacteriales bacterium]